MTLVQEQDGARAQTAFDSRDHGLRIAVHRIEPAHRPADELHPAAGQQRVDEEIFQARGRAERAGAQRVPIDLQREPRGRVSQKLPLG